MIGIEVKKHLLCTFSSIEDFQRDIEEIKKFYNIKSSNKFFVFSNVNSPKEVFITYSVSLKDGKKFINTISIHRKKEYNILFSLNAMNQLIKDENNGILDKKFVIDWNLYSDSLIITGSPLIKIIPIKILKIVSY